eukprot:366501-Chlamydomonas_euryale.AAC.23
MAGRGAAHLGMYCGEEWSGALGHAPCECWGRRGGERRTRTCPVWALGVAGRGGTALCFHWQQSQSYRERTHKGYACVERSKTEGIKPARARAIMGQPCAAVPASA